MCQADLYLEVGRQIQWACSEGALAELEGGNGLDPGMAALSYVPVSDNTATYRLVSFRNRPGFPESS